MATSSGGSVLYAWPMQSWRDRFASRGVVDWPTQWRRCSLDASQCRQLLIGLVIAAPLGGKSSASSTAILPLLHRCHPSTAIIPPLPGTGRRQELTTPLATTASRARRSTNSQLPKLVGAPTASFPSSIERCGLREWQGVC